METDGVNLRSIRWSELFPWLAIGRCFRLAIAPRMLVLGAIGVIVNLVGCWLLALAFGAGGQPNKWFGGTFGANSPIEFVNRGVPNVPSVKPISEQVSAVDIESMATDASYPYRAPFQMLFSLTANDWGDDAYLILAALLSVAVWGYAGGAMSRIAAVQLAADEKVGFIAATRWACRKYLSYCAAPLFPLLGVALAAIPLWFVGVLQRADFGVLVTGPFWILALACGFFMALLLLGLAFGWPLMWSTISVEGTDSFDALSRTYAYVLQRPVRYAWYVFVAAAMGFLGLLFVNAFAAAVLWMTTWGTSLGCGGDRATAIMQAASDPQSTGDLHGYVAGTGIACIAFWRLAVKCLALGYVPAYFWTASTSIYLLLRRDVDATETDEVYLDADASEQSAPLPPITADAAGAPQVATADVPSNDGQGAAAEPVKPEQDLK